jgi:hypothetical protein
MFAYRLIAPFVIFGAIAGTLAFYLDDHRYGYVMAAMLVVSAVIYFLSGEINWWYYSRNPLPMPEGLRPILAKGIPFYQQLSPEEKKRFEQRTMLFRMGTDWTPTGWGEDAETLPPDVEVALAAQAVMLTFKDDNILLEPFEKVIVYPRAFPTPDYQYAHASELYVPDACLLFSAETLMLAIAQPGQWYNIGLHEYAKVWLLRYPERHLPDFPDTPETWASLQEISGMPRTHIESVIGLKEPVSPVPVALHHFFMFREKFVSAFPEASAVFKQYFI